ncbi:hypothetical protein [Streptomyces bacillaris]|uniref:hypothetical protein n=1 Tax=Streptomyces bacillaris TaxID=68179 RepID=UPI00380DABEF
MRKPSAGRCAPRARYGGCAAPPGPYGPSGPADGVLPGNLGAVAGLARTGRGDGPLPPAMPLLHLLTDDGGH